MVKSGCWIWTGGTNGKYPVFGISRDQNVYAHRFSYESFVGTIPSGETIDHQCNNKLCVNPDHLKPMSQRDNHRRWRDQITHCMHGHPFDEKNTWTEKTGSRHCRECHRKRESARRIRMGK